MLWRTVLVASVVAATVLGADKLGVKFVPWTKEAGLQSANPAGTPDSLQVWTQDGGDLSARLLVKVEAADPTKCPLVATFARPALATKKPLAADKSDADAKDGWYDVFEQAAADRRMLDWPVDARITLTPKVSSPPVKLQDWEVHFKDGGHDSSDRARWRFHWGWLSWSLFALALVAPAWEAWGKFQTLNKPTRRGFREQMIGQVQGATDAETKVLQAVLREVYLNRLDPINATSAAGLSGKQAWQLWQKAKLEFEVQCQVFLNQTQDWHVAPGSP